MEKLDKDAFNSEEKTGRGGLLALRPVFPWVYSTYFKLSFSVNVVTHKTQRFTLCLLWDDLGI